jgi:phosphoribosylformylglycinamidine cyclo-ligase
MPDEWNYKKAGLDLEKYAESMAGIAPLLARTWDTSRLIPPPFPARKGGKGTAGFASLFDLKRGYNNPVLVTCTDGVGSKLKIASAMQRFDTVGIDLVAMSVNDLICTGGEPLVFLDYLAMPKDDPELTRQLVKGISDGCVEAGCSLSGGETAILPDFYSEGDFDMAGFAAGMVEKERIIDGRAISTGDVVIGLASSGVHSNGFSLVRKLVFEAGKLTVNDRVPELGGTVGDALLTPTKLYVKTIRHLLDSVQGVTGLANITGGGLPDNISRILPPDCKAVLTRGSWPVLPVFRWLQNLGNVAVAEMDRVFNMGVGFCVVCKPEAADNVLVSLGSEAFRIGEIVGGPAGVEFA